MPWVSKKQAAWGHSPSGVKALGEEGVKEFDAATPKGSLPDSASSKPKHWPGTRKIRRADNGAF